MDRKKKISCQRCQLRKIKCSRCYPCSSCTLVGQECKFRSDDRKRRPVGRDYVVALEAQVAHYESILRKAKAADGEERDELLNSVALTDHATPVPRGNAVSEPIIDTRGSSRMSTMSLQPSLQGSLLFYGPTSMYQKDIPLDKQHPGLNSGNSPPHTDLKEMPSLKVPQSLRIEDSVLNESLSLFFAYQYPQFMFIHREAFLRDYYGNVYQGKYWSYPLLYAICALGARASTDERVRDKGDVLSHCAETIILTNALGLPHLTVAQALLCLAFYELGSGNHSKGWIFAGMAFRMGLDLGLQQDPRFLVSQDSTIASDQDLMIRRHVYYGMYASDKLISLYLGRPVMLYEEEAAVNLPEPLPESAGQDWFGVSKLPDSDLEHPSEAIIMSAFRGIIELSQIAEEMLFKVFSTKMIKKPRRDLVLCRSSRLEEISVRLGRWHNNLPTSLTWNQWNPYTGVLMPHLYILHLLYYSILITLNRHFIRPTPGFAAKELSKETCISSADAIIGLIRQFRAQHGLERCPVVVVYSAVMAGSGILFTLGPSTLVTEKDRRLSFIIKVLDECSPTHNLAREARIKLLANIDARRSATAEAAQTPQPMDESGFGKDAELADISSTGWVDGSMFDLGAFDLGAFGSLDPMAFDGIGPDLYQGITSSNPDPLLMQPWIATSPPEDFASPSRKSELPE